MLSEFFLLVLLVSAFVHLAFRRGLIYLHIAQQDEYSPTSLWSWLKANLAFDKQVTILGLFIILTSYFTQYYLTGLSLGAGLLYLISLTTINPLKQAKLPLNMTLRAKRVFGVYLFVTFLILILFLFVHSNCRGALFFAPIVVMVQALPFLMMLALKVLAPIEQRIQQGYLSDAERIVRDVQPFIIGVTGSFGKTSVKNYLAEVLQVCHGSTFWPRGGVNTLMGVTKEVRSRLNSNYKYAVIEMAAYRIGSIAKLCKLTPPKAAIITAIGRAHLERFGSLDVTYQAKTELAKALDQDGILVCNADDPLVKKAGEEFKTSETYFYSLEQVENVKISTEGTSFDFRWQGATYFIQTKLLGKTAISNLLAVFTMAAALGARPELIADAISNLPPVKNRLQLEQAGDYTYLHDAYNSNEIGFASALDILAELDASQRVIMTPGVVELGDEQFEINKDLAEQASKVCDSIIVVGEVNREAFIAGSSVEKLHVVDDRDAAFAKLNEIKKSGSVILIENDLNDFYEAKYRF